MNKLIKDVVRGLVMQLVEGKFNEIVDQGKNGRLTAIDIEQAIKEYPGRISAPPEAAYDKITIYDVYDKERDARKLEFELWYDNRESDLTLSADIKKNSKGELVITIDDIHVL